MKAFLLLVLVAVALAARSESEYRTLFTNWMLKNNKVYSFNDFRSRYATFKDNTDFVDAHNADGSKTFTVAINKFADLTAAEFAATFNGLTVTKDVTKLTHISNNPIPVGQLPPSKDWRQSGAVTGIKNQGQCGSCWSFSATGSTEGVHFLSTNNLVGLSEQNLVDCSTSQGNEGCNGGLMDYAFEYIIQNNGIDTEASYPYSATGPNQCQFSASNVGATLSSYQDVSSGDESALQVAVNKNPTSVAIDASHSSFQFYSGGVYYESACSSSQLDHGVLAIGWGTDSSSGNAYWLVKNSWGTDWGLSGYIWMSRNQNNNCGIATAASYPIA